MKKIFLVVLSLALSTQLAFAHCGTCGVGDEKASKGSHKGSKSGKMSKLTKKLGLTDEQAKQVQAIKAEMMDLKKSVREDTKKKIEGIKADYKLKLKGILTEDQFKKYESMMGKKKGSRKGSGHDKHDDHDSHHGHDH